MSLCCESRSTHQEQRAALLLPGAAVLGRASPRRSPPEGKLWRKKSGTKWAAWHVENTRRQAAALACVSVTTEKVQGHLPQARGVVVRHERGAETATKKLSYLSFIFCPKQKKVTRCGRRWRWRGHALRCSRIVQAHVGVEARRVEVHVPAAASDTCSIWDSTHCRSSSSTCAAVWWRVMQHPRVTRTRSATHARVPVQ